ncbi:RNA polymerase subunit sigma-70 [Niastella yeongjuensis]|uniref:RNA polymerase subunit sigma-70 n=1 Tax=Niastella yeongjuensis TaxID=354355 RepID=A0A1V9EFN3_9BACT|nr:sigma-70 family RNA polymerase sigma factor [Niastella yeongjuensis]OQP44735.1 RNA polymerase subunit sigma-70 [Niastella yeongjuensis]SEO77271.1 RNA polymerase sigma-70 factor, ECF subfamily [Niastella yeongjuensis]
MDSLRPLLTSYAYNILGSYEDAKDIVQDVLLEMINRTGADIQNEKAYLTRSVINRAINARNRLQKMQSGYPGSWLPEPVAAETADGDLNRKDILSYSLMVLLERLDAKQRAVFILKEAFNYEHEEIAEVLDISVENSRKILSRARAILHNEPISEVVKVPADFLDKYMEVIHSRDIKKLEQLLSDDVLVVADGGGKVRAAIKPLEGIESAAAYMYAMYTKYYDVRHIVQGKVNHDPALFYYVDGQLTNCQIFEWQDGKIRRVYFVRNPDKLIALSKEKNDL